MKGTKYLSENPQARAEDIIWAFENKNIKAIIANIGGNDSIQVIPQIKTRAIIENPKIFIGYSDIQNVHLLCYKSGLSTFYGHNLLSTIADAQGLHPYSEKWFRKVLFDISPIGPINPPANCTYAFYREDKARSRKSGRNGLGLAIARKTPLRASCFG